jgi:hypothetical protein
LKFFQQTLIENFPAGFDLDYSGAVVIAIENVSRIDQGLNEHVLMDPCSDMKTLSGLKPRR